MEDTKTAETHILAWTCTVCREIFLDEKTAADHHLTCDGAVNEPPQSDQVLTSLAQDDSTCVVVSEGVAVEEAAAAQTSDAVRVEHVDDPGNAIYVHQPQLEVPNQFEIVTCSEVTHAIDSIVATQSSEVMDFNPVISLVRASEDGAFEMDDPGLEVRVRKPEAVKIKSEIQGTFLEIHEEKSDAQVQEPTLEDEEPGTSELGSAEPGSAEPGSSEPAPADGTPGEAKEQPVRPYGRQKKPWEGIKFDGEPQVCPICRQSFLTDVALRLHVKGEHKQTEKKLRFWNCEFCTRLFHDEKKFEEHCKSHEEGKEQFVCKECDLVYFSQLGLRQHKKQHNELNHWCNICDRGFKTRGGLKLHVVVHDPSMPHSCDECGKKFKRPSDLAAHLVSHIKHKCQFCEREFRQKWQLERHILHHTGERPRSCDICGKKFKNTHGLSVHRKTHNLTEAFKCHICKKQYITQTHFQLHLKTHSENEGFTPNDMHCNVCNVLFESKAALKRHKDTHKRHYDCTDCGKTFHTWASLHGHSFLHTGIKPFECKKCNVGYRHQASLRLHLKSKAHKIGRWFICKICEKGFSEIASLNKHMERHQPQPCPECNGEFYGGATELREHMRREHPKTPANCCEYCGEVFRTVEMLCTHKMKHRQRGDQKLKCAHCLRRFYDPKLLNEHIAQDHAELALQCELCNLVFETEEGWEEHMNELHAGLGIATRKTKVDLAASVSGAPNSEVELAIASIGEPNQECSESNLESSVQSLEDSSQENAGISPENSAQSLERSVTSQEHSYMSQNGSSLSKDAGTVQVSESEITIPLVKQSNYYRREMRSRPTYIDPKKIMEEWERNKYKEEDFLGERANVEPDDEDCEEAEKSPEKLEEIGAKRGKIPKKASAKKAKKSTEAGASVETSESKSKNQDKQTSGSETQDEKTSESKKVGSQNLPTIMLMISPAQSGQKILTLSASRMTAGATDSKAGDVAEKKMVELQVVNNLASLVNSPVVKLVKLPEKLGEVGSVSKTNSPARKKAKVSSPENDAASGSMQDSEDSRTPNILKRRGRRSKMERYKAIAPYWFKKKDAGENEKAASGTTQNSEDSRSPNILKSKGSPSKMVASPENDAASGTTQDSEDSRSPNILKSKGSPSKMVASPETDVASASVQDLEDNGSPSISKRKGRPSKTEKYKAISPYWFKKRDARENENEKTAKQVEKPKPAAASKRKSSQPQKISAQSEILSESSSDNEDFCIADDVEPESSDSDQEEPVWEGIKTRSSRAKKAGTSSSAKKAGTMKKDTGVGSKDGKLEVLKETVDKTGTKVVYVLVEKNSRALRKEENNMVCQLCGKAFLVHRDLVKHRKLHKTGTRKWKCIHCKMDFFNGDFLFHLEQHLKEYKDRDGWKCKRCEFVSDDAAAFESHARNHVVMEQLCLTCNEVIPGDYLAHIVLHRKRRRDKSAPTAPWKCDQCSEAFFFKFDLHDHMLTHAVSLQYYKCPTCREAFRTMDLYSEHVRTHAKQVTVRLCFICNETCFSESELSEHLKNHLSKHFVCTVCDAKFEDEKVYKAHVKEFHSFICKKCDEMFHSEWEYKAHLREADCGIPETWECSNCKKNFDDRKGLAEHLLNENCTKPVKSKTKKSDAEEPQPKKPKKTATPSKRKQKHRFIMWDNH